MNKNTIITIILILITVLGFCTGFLWGSNVGIDYIEDSCLKEVNGLYVQLNNFQNGLCSVPSITDKGVILVE